MKIFAILNLVFFVLLVVLGTYERPKIARAGTPLPSILLRDLAQHLYHSQNGSFEWNLCDHGRSLGLM